MHPAVETLAAMARNHGQDLRHVLTCPRCRDLLTQLLDPETEAGSDSPNSADVPEALLSAQVLAQRLLDRSFDILRESDQQRAAARAKARFLYQELLNFPPDVRLDVVDSQSRFLTVEIGELLLSDAQEAFEADPLQANHLAALAVAILERISPDSARVRAGLASAYCLLADTERLRGRHGLAGDLLETAVRQLRDELLEGEPRARLCRALGDMRKEQECVDEAVALLERARALAAKAGCRDELAAATLSLGWLLLEEMETPAALEHLREAERLARSAGLHPHRQLSALHGLALGYAELVDVQNTAETRQSLEALKPRLNSPRDHILIDWIGAQIDFRLGERVKARKALEAIFHRFKDASAPFDAAAVVLELAYHSLQDETRTALTEKLARELAESGLLAPYPAAVVGFALDFATRTHRRGCYLDVLHNAVTYLDKVRFNPALPFHPLAEPDAFLLWSELSAPQRRELARTSRTELDDADEPKTRRDRCSIGWTHEALTGVRIEFPSGTAPDWS